MEIEGCPTNDCSLHGLYYQVPTKEPTWMTLEAFYATVKVNKGFYFRYMADHSPLWKLVFLAVLRHGCVRSLYRIHIGRTNYQI